MTSDLSNLVCGRNNNPNDGCLQNFGIEATKIVLEDVYQTLQEEAIAAYCKNDIKKGFYSKDQLYQFITSRFKFYNLETEAALSGIKMVAVIYPNLSIAVEDEGFLFTEPSLPWTCTLQTVAYNFANSLFRFGVVCFTILIVIFTIKWIKRTRTMKQENLKNLVNDIIDLIQKNAISNPANAFLPISYVHSHLIPAVDRQNKLKLWEDAVRIVDSNESRIRREIQVINGEEYIVWRWLPRVPLASKCKMWQGEAFMTTKGTMNSPVVSPTQCLKIRHMFDPNQEDKYGDWVTVLQNAILERCEGARILHIAVDENNAEGCIYVKCVSTEDAGNAYRKMHGAWFDGKIVSVKYIRLERYHERFPESISLANPLLPTNNLRSSLQ